MLINYDQTCIIDANANVMPINPDQSHLFEIHSAILLYYGSMLYYGLIRISDHFLNYGRY